LCGKAGPVVRRRTPAAETAGTSRRRADGGDVCRRGGDGDRELPIYSELTPPMEFAIGNCFAEACRLTF